MNRTIDIPTRPATVLRALPGGRAASAAEPDADGPASSRAECTISRAATRAGDRHEPWTLPASAALELLADAAAAAGVEFELAARLVLERALACADLRALGVDPAALAWEIAAVLSGRTISEWAPLTALRALTPASH